MSRLLSSLATVPPSPYSWIAGLQHPLSKFPPSSFPIYHASLPELPRASLCPSRRTSPTELHRLCLHPPCPPHHARFSSLWLLQMRGPSTRGGARRNLVTLPFGSIYRPLIPALAVPRAIKELLSCGCSCASPLPAGNVPRILVKAHEPTRVSTFQRPIITLEVNMHVSVSEYF